MNQEFTENYTLSVSLNIPTKEFNEHLSDISNKRIIFSGAFGSGKTYFLKEFFKDNDKYEVIYLRPVNYSVSSNDDVFELIKFDILFHLLSKDIKFDYTKFDYFTSLQWYVYNKPVKFLNGFLI